MFAVGRWPCRGDGRVLVPLQTDIAKGYHMSIHRLRYFRDVILLSVLPGCGRAEPITLMMPFAHIGSRITLRCSSTY